MNQTINQKVAQEKKKIQKRLAASKNSVLNKPMFSGGKVHFECPVDIQTTLQTRDHARIESTARDYIDKLAAPFGGGFIAGYYGSNPALGLDPAYQETAHGPVGSTEHR